MFPIGCDSVLDVTVVNPLQRSTLVEAVHIPGVAMGKAVVKKRDQYRGKVQPNQVFKPMAFETLGDRMLRQCSY